RTSKRTELRTVETLQLGVGELQRRQRRGYVASEQQLLARELQHLLDLGQRPFVARRRELAIKRLERRLLVLRFGETAFEQGNLRLCFTQALLRFLEPGAGRLIDGLDVAETLGDI